MSEQYDPTTGQAHQHTESDLAGYKISTEPVKRPSTTRKWLSGAALVAAGLVAGSGATYAATSATQPIQTQSGFQGGPRGMGGPPEGMSGAPGGPGQQGVAPDSATNTQPGTGTQTG